MTQYKGNKPKRKHNHHVHFKEIYIPRVGKCGTKLEFNLDIIFNLVKLNTATRVHFSMFQVYRKVRNTIMSRRLGKPTAYAKTKTQISFAVTSKHQCLCFR